MICVVISRDVLQHEAADKGVKERFFVQKRVKRSSAAIETEDPPLKKGRGGLPKGQKRKAAAQAAAAEEAQAAMRPGAMANAKPKPKGKPKGAIVHLSGGQTVRVTAADRARFNRALFQRSTNEDIRQDYQEG